MPEVRPASAMAMTLEVHIGLFQPFIHNQVICLAAPAVAIFGVDGQIRGTGAQGLYLADSRIISTLVVRLNGYEPEPISCALTEPNVARIVSVYRGGDEPTPDPVVILEQVRDIRALTERLSLRNHGRHPVMLDLDVEIAADFAPTFVIKTGGRNQTCPSSPVHAGIRFRDPSGSVTITAHPRPEIERGHLHWRIELDPGATWTTTLTVAIEGVTAPVVRASSVPWRRPRLGSGDVRLNELTIINGGGYWV